MLRRVAPIARRPWILAVVGTVLAVVVVAGVALWPRPTWWVTPDAQAARWVADPGDDGRAALISARILPHPTGVLLNGAQSASFVDDVLSAAAAQHRRPLLVLYNIPHRDCADGRSSGGASSFAEYRAWVDSIAAALAGRPATVIIEPDILASIGACLPPAEQTRVSEAIGYAVDAIRTGSPASAIYVDAGHSEWLPPAEMAAVLAESGVHRSDGIATNVSNFRTTRAETAYARAVLAALGDRRLGAVIDTSRNGNGPGTTWCDPPGRALGRAPTTRTFSPRVDAYVWAKIPGEADGCAAPAGVFDPQIGYELAANH